MALMHRHSAVAVLVVLALAGCETITAQPAVQAAAEPVLRTAAKDQPKAEISFIDFQGFDRDLNASLAAPLPKVDVVFLDNVSPNSIPERMQVWLAAVEAGGGKVQITEPKPDIVAKDPFLIIGLFNAAWHASSLAKSAAVKAQHAPAKAFDAQIVLKKNDAGNSVMDRVVFTKHE